MWYISTMEYYLATKKEWSSDICYNGYQPQKHYIKKDRHKYHILYNLIYMQYPE